MVLMHCTPVPRLTVDMHVCAGGSAGEAAARGSATASALAQAFAAALLLLSVHVTMRQLRQLAAMCSTLPGTALDLSVQLVNVDSLTSTVLRA